MAAAVTQHKSCSCPARSSAVISCFFCEQKVAGGPCQRVMLCNETRSPESINTELKCQHRSKRAGAEVGSRCQRDEGMMPLSSSLLVLLACREAGRRASQLCPCSGALCVQKWPPGVEGERPNPHDPGGDGEGAEMFGERGLGWEETMGWLSGAALGSGWL